MRRLRKYGVFAKISFANAIAYPIAVVGPFCFYAIIIYVMACLWRTIYRDGGPQGYTYAQMVWYLLMTEFISFICGTSLFHEMNEEIKSGSIAYRLSRPVHYVLYQFANVLGQAAFNSIAFGLLAVVLGMAFAGPLPGFSLAAIPALAVSVILSIILNYFFLMMIGLSAFLLEENTAVFWIYQKLAFMLGMLLPVELLPPWLQTVAKALPFSYVFWAPARIFVGYSPEICLALLPRQAFWAASAIALTLLGYHMCTKHLQVNGG